MLGNSAWIYIIKIKITCAQNLLKPFLPNLVAFLANKSNIWGCKQILLLKG